MMIALKMPSLEEFINEKLANPEVGSPKELDNFLEKNLAHLTSFLKPRKLDWFSDGEAVTILAGSKSFTIKVDFKNKVIKATEKPKLAESTSYVELLDNLKNVTRFKVTSID